MTNDFDSLVQEGVIRSGSRLGFVAISARQPEAHGRHIRRLVVVLWGTTAFGVIALAQAG